MLSLDLSSRGGILRFNADTILATLSGLLYARSSSPARLKRKFRDERIDSYSVVDRPNIFQHELHEQRLQASAA